MKTRDLLAIKTRS